LVEELSNDGRNSSPLSNEPNEALPSAKHRSGKDAAVNGGYSIERLTDGEMGVAASWVNLGRRIRVKFLPLPPLGLGDIGGHIRHLTH
jgi:hypothetical protein